ncbi:MAG: class II aldolase/adducin family protein [Actinomycetales bacterium]|nr:class II aldolase/adducin family protein [Actinomycetales bacterium]
MSAVRPEIQVAIARLRDDLAERLAAGEVAELSERVAGSELFLLALAGRTLAPGDLVLCDAAGDPVPDTPGAGAWTSAAHAHAALYAAHPDVAAIARTGSDAAPVYRTGPDARTALGAPTTSRAD